MERLLISTVVWCPPAQPARVDTICAHLAALGDFRRRFPFVDVHIVDNDVAEPRLLAAMSEAGDVERFSPQIGWARGRNVALRRFRDDGRYLRLAMTDCDQGWDDPDWPAAVLRLAHTDPDLHAYMIRVDKWQLKARGTLGTGTPVDVYGEWYGTTNVIDRRVVERVGALNVEDFPQDWGFHDCEWGRRLRRAGLLDVVHGHFVDPIRVGGSLGHDADYDAAMAGLKDRCIGRYAAVFAAREREIQAGGRVFIPLGDAP